MLKGRASVKQILNFWQQCWDKYKAVRERQEHTGGGDGDESRDEADSGNDEDLEVELGDGDKKRKRDGKEGKKKERYSAKVLGRFEQSNIFAMIDAV